MPSLYRTSTLLLSLCFLSLILLCAFILTMLSTHLFRRYALKNNVMDIPNARSSHTLPTPRGGGISVVIIYCLALVFLILFSTKNLSDGVDLSSCFGLLLGGGLVAVIGFWDDHQSIPAKWRFLAHLVAAGVIMGLVTLPKEVNLLGWNIVPGILAYPFFILMLIWLLNLYNFMDGIDGLASVEVITVLLGASMILAVNHSWSFIFIQLLLVASVFGFLVFNWPPAKIFMGDACSGFLGFVIGVLALSSSASGSINLWSWLILLGVFVVDATVTLVRRVNRGDTWHEAHRSHAYQILSRKFNSHKKVTLGVLVINILWLFPLAMSASVWPDFGVIFALAALLPLVMGAIKVGAGLPEKH
jgi:Fuc2NAc and GlcNAc transferase